MWSLSHSNTIFPTTLNFGGTPEQQTLCKASTHLSNEDDLLRDFLNKNLYLDKILCSWPRLVGYYIDL